MVTGLAGATHVVDRPALRRRLDQSLVLPLSLIVAPAGAGKSVLLAQWVSSHPELDFVWLEVTEADNDPVRFAQRLMLGLAEIRPEFADFENLISLHGGGLGTAMVEALGSQLARFPEVVIVLDDLNRLSNAALLGDLGRLAALLPPNAHLVLSTRVDLPIAWSRHRLRHEVVEIRQADLALDEAASAQLLERIAGRPMGADAVTALVNRTEGWAAGLQLAAMTLRLHADPEEFVAQFSGNDRLIADYLSEEVLGAQSESRRELLLRISILDEMCADLVAHLTGEPNPQLVLEELERESMFLVPLDTTRSRFRFHHLFRDLLRFRLRAEDPPAEARLLVQAADWHLERQEVSVAVEYLLRARDWPRALDVIMARGSEVFERGQMATVIRWINLVPGPARAGRHDVSLLLGILTGMDGHLAGAEDTLRRVATDPEASPGERACALTFQAAMAQGRPRPEISIDMARRALDALDDLADDQPPVIMNLSDPQSLKTMAVVSGGRAHFYAGHTDEARDWLERGMASAGVVYSIWRISTLGSLGLLEAWCGRTRRVDRLVDEALAIARDAGLLAHPCTADAFLATTLASLERGEPHRAAVSLHEGTVRAMANRRTQLSWIGLLETGLLQAAQGQVEEATGTILSTSSKLRSPPPPLVADGMLALRSRLLRLSGSPERALDILTNVAPTSCAVAFELGAAALMLGRVDLARKALDAVPTIGETTAPLATVQHLILLAWMSEAEGYPDDVRTHLLDAMATAERHSLVDVFVRVGPPIVGLLSGLPDVQASFRESILQRARDVYSASPGGELVDPLTNRELEILTYLPGRYTNAELAEHCYVSVNTIKTHMAHIYRKLGVANRRGAIVRAREIGLL